MSFHFEHDEYQIGIQHNICALEFGIIFDKLSNLNDENF